MSTPNDSESTDARLGRLSEEINQHHGKVMTAFRTTLRHAREVGIRLIKAKELLAGSGEYHAWIGDHTDLSLDQAQRYTRVANHWARIKKLANNLEEVTLTEALKLLSQKEKSEGQDAGKREDSTQPLPLPEGLDLDTLAEEARSMDIAKDEKVTRFIEEKVSGIARQIIRLAGGKKGKGDGGPKAVEPAKLAMAVLFKLKTALKQSLIVKPAEEATPHDAGSPGDRRPGPEQTLNAASKPSRNGHGQLAAV